MNDKVPCSSTKLIRGGTAYSSSPFELNLQLHRQVNNPYNFGIKQNYKSSAATKASIPPYTEKSWTIPGTYIWTVPVGVTRIKAEVAGAGGGSGAAHGASFNRVNSGAGGRGELTTKQVSVQENPVYSIVVGAGGLAGVNDFDEQNGKAGENSSAFGIVARGGGGGTGGWMGYGNGVPGVSYGNGGLGGASVSHKGSSGGYDGNNGQNGWVKIAYGQGIE